MRKRYPFVKQEGLKDCGSACLAMIVKYYKGNISIDRLRDLTKTNKNGVNAYNLIKACEEIGFYAKGVKGKIDDISNIVLPCIAHVVIKNSYKHYIVIYEINYDNKNVVIADPAFGIKKISFDEFNDIWTGVLIILYPIKPLPFNKSINIFNFIIKIIFDYKNDLLLLLLLSFLVIILKLFTSFYFKFIIDGIEISKNYLKSMFLLFSLLSFSKLIINYFRNKVLVILNCKIDFALTLDAFKRIILLPYHYYHNRTTGEVVSKINDLSNVRNIISKICVSFLIDLPLIIISSVFLIKINVHLFVVALILLLMYIFISLIYKKIYSSYICKIKHEKEMVNSYMYECISGFETVKGLNIENKVIYKFNNMYISLLNKIYKLQNHINNQGFFKDFVTDLGNIFILYFGSLLVFDNKLTLGFLITFSSMIAYFLDPIRNIIDMDVDIIDSKESITRVLSLYEDYHEKGIINFRCGNIEFKNLCFNYDNNIVLNKINLKINKGEKVMIYGTSGSGKSTLLKLLMGYYNVNRGMLFIDDVDIKDYKIKSLRKNIVYISQNELLFNDSIINNMNFFADNDDIVRMADIVKFNEILDNDLGFNMMIEENGSNLSGGERQRIILARALLRKSQIILIDEGFSQIDSKLERQILSNIFEKYCDKTIIIISHRMENLDLYNHLICINEGEIIKDEVK